MNSCPPSWQPILAASTRRRNRADDPDTLRRNSRAHCGDPLADRFLRRSAVKEWPHELGDISGRAGRLGADQGIGSLELVTV